MALAAISLMECEFGILLSFLVMHGYNPSFDEEKRKENSEGVKISTNLFVVCC